MNDIQTGISDFDSALYFESGEDFGEAAGLIFFGRSIKEVSTMDQASYNSYLILSGFS